MHVQICVYLWRAFEIHTFKILLIVTGLYTIQKVFKCNTSWNEIIKNFESSPKYTIIKPNTRICDIELTIDDDITINGLFELKTGTKFYENIISLNTDELLNNMERIYTISENKKDINVKYDFNYNDDIADLNKSIKVYFK